MRRVPTRTFPNPPELREWEWEWEWEWESESDWESESESESVSTAGRPLLIQESAVPIQDTVLLE
jgi:hypothetical protein